MRCRTCDLDMEEVKDGDEIIGYRCNRCGSWIGLRAIFFECCVNPNVGYRSERPRSISWVSTPLHRYRLEKWL